MTDEAAADPGVPAPASRKLAIFAFALSLFGLLCSFGLASPVALIVGVVAWRKGQGALAIAATVIGAVGTMLLPFLLAGLVGMIAVLVPTAQGRQKTEAAFDVALRRVAEIRSTTGGTIDPAQAHEAVAGIVDGWGTPLRCDVGDDGAVSVRSAGRDTVFDTADDRVR